MQIDVVQSVAPISPRTPDPQPAIVLRHHPVAPVSAAVAAVPTSSVSLSTSVTSASSSSSTAPSGAFASVSAGASASQGLTNSALIEASLVAFYSTVFGGKKYPAAVESTGNGHYTAFVATLPGASASGSSVQSAEDALGPVIDLIA